MRLGRSAYTQPCQLSQGAANWQILDPSSKNYQTFPRKILKLIQNGEMSLIEHRRFYDSISDCSVCYLIFTHVSSVTPSERYKLKYICMKAKDILAFIVVESGQVFGPFPQTVGDHRF